MNPEILGHENIRSRLEKLASRSVIPHAILFSGPRGVGKKQVAIELFQTLYCEKKNTYGGCQNCDSCTRLRKNNLPNFSIVDCKDKDTCSVEQIRQLLYELHLSVSPGSQKVLILDNAEYLSTHSQNVILKALEEPGRNTYFCLITASLSKLLKTVQSRCQTWHFQTLSKAHIESILSKNKLIAEHDKETQRSMSKLTDGSLENIDTIVNGQHIWKLAQQTIESLKDSKLHLALSTFKDLKTNKDEIRIFLDAMRVLARENMLEESNPSEKFNWSVLLTNCIEAEYLILERNLSVEIVLSNIALSFIEPSRTLPFTSVGNDVNLLSELYS